MTDEPQACFDQLAPKRSKVRMMFTDYFVDLFFMIALIKLKAENLDRLEE